MRIIKFRALVRYFSQENHRWEYYSTLSEPTWADPCIADVKIKDLQYTSLKDKNGVEIYEGDIVSPGYTDYELFVVVFDETKARFAEQRVSKEYPTSAGFIMDGSFLRSTMKSQRVEVIGNIYSNPELLTN